MNWQLYFQSAALMDIGITIGIFLIFLVFRKIFTKYIYSLLLKLSRKAPTQFLSHVFESFEKPIQWLFIILGVYVAAKYFPYFNENNATFLTILRAAFIFLFSWGLFNLSSSANLLITRVNDKMNLEVDQILIPFLSKAIRFVIIAISFTVIVQEFGYDISGFVAGLGIGGLAISFAAKDVLANLLGGIVIITEKPFTIGEWIMTPSVEGTVEEITFRSTKVRTFAQALVTVPNNTLANEPITNWSKMTKRQITFNLKVMYDTPREKIEVVVKKIDDMLRNHTEIDQEAITVVFDQYMENGLTIYMNFFTKTTVYKEFIKIKEDLNLKIMDILDTEGVSLAVPTSKLYVDPEKDKKANPSLS